MNSETREERQARLARMAAELRTKTRETPAADLAYQRAHRAVTRDFGRAANHDCTNCSAKAAEWSLIPSVPCAEIRGRGRTGERIWSDDTGSYSPLCIPCHRAQDSANRRALVELAGVKLAAMGDE